MSICLFYEITINSFFSSFGKQYISSPSNGVFPRQLGRFPKQRDVGQGACAERFVGEPDDARVGRDCLLFVCFFFSNWTKYLSLIGI